jgi:hypothetical protein
MMTQYDPAHITIKDDRGCWKRLPRNGWQLLAGVILEEAAKWEADAWCMWSNPDEPARMRTYADRINKTLQIP